PGRPQRRAGRRADLRPPRRALRQGPSSASRPGRRGLALQLLAGAAGPADHGLPGGRAERHGAGGGAGAGGLAGGRRRALSGARISPRARHRPAPDVRLRGHALRARRRRPGGGPAGGEPRESLHPRHLPGRRREPHRAPRQQRGPHLTHTPGSPADLDRVGARGGSDWGSDAGAGGGKQGRAPLRGGPSPPGPIGANLTWTGRSPRPKTLTPPTPLSHPPPRRPGERGAPKKTGLWWLIRGSWLFSLFSRPAGGGMGEEGRRVMRVFFY